MAKNKPCIIVIALIVIITASVAHSAAISYTFTNHAVIFSGEFQKGYSSVNAYKNEENKQIIIDFVSTEPVTFDPPLFFEGPIASVEMRNEASRYRLYFNFESALVEPTVKKLERSFVIEFPITLATADGNTTDSPSGIGIGAYFRMFFGLGVILIIILVSYAIMRYFFKANIVTDIPGVGRLLGRINLDVKKSLVFYELGDTIYILGVTDNAINIVDKLTSPAEVTVIKSGFSKRKDFSSYMKFFKKNELSEEFTDSAEQIKEKVSSIRKTKP